MYHISKPHKSEQYQWFSKDFLCYFDVGGFFDGYRYESNELRKELFADVVSYSDYYPFGMQMPNRNGSSGDYRYEFYGLKKLFHTYFVINFIHLISIDTRENTVNYFISNSI